MTTTWRIVARTPEHLAPDWRTQLAARPGVSLRRIGGYAERVLAGALTCLDGHALPQAARIRLGSRTGAAEAMETLADQARAGEPLMPFTFMQSLPAQALAVLARQLGWRGDAAFQLHANPAAVLALALVEADEKPLLFGWVDEPACSRWCLCMPDAGQADDTPAWTRLAAGELPPPAATRMRREGSDGVFWA